MGKRGLSRVWTFQSMRKGGASRLRLRHVLLLSVVTIESVDPAPHVSVNNEESSSENDSLMIASLQSEELAFSKNDIYIS